MFCLRNKKNHFNYTLLSGSLASSYVVFGTYTNSYVKSLTYRGLIFGLGICLFPYFVYNPLYFNHSSQSATITDIFVYLGMCVLAESNMFCGCVLLWIQTASCHSTHFDWTVRLTCITYFHLYHS